MRFAVASGMFADEMPAEPWETPDPSGHPGSHSGMRWWRCFPGHCGRRRECGVPCTVLCRRWRTPLPVVIPARLAWTVTNGQRCLHHPSVLLWGSIKIIAQTLQPQTNLWFVSCRIRAIPALWLLPSVVMEALVHASCTPASRPILVLPGQPCVACQCSFFLGAVRNKLLFQRQLFLSVSITLPYPN